LAIKKRTITVVLISAIVIGTLFASAWFYASYQLARLESHKEFITKTIKEKLHRDVAYETGKASVTLRDGLSLRFTNVVITEKDRSSDFLTVKTAFFRVKIIPLFANKIVFKEVILEQPVISLKRDRAGVLNIADILEQKKKKTVIELQRLTIQKGRVTFFDQALSEEGLLTSLDNLDCWIDSSFVRNTSYFNMTASVIEDENKADLLLNGTYHPALPEKPVYESTVNASMHLKGTDIKHYDYYLKHYTPIKKLAGYLNANIKFSGQLSDFTSKGTVAVKDALIVYPKVFESNLHPKNISIDYALDRNTDNLKVKVRHLKVDNFEASGNFAINDMDKKDPLLEGNAQTSVFSYKEFKSYIPWKIIPKGVGNYIKTHVKDGNFRLVEGKLKGKQSQIAGFNKKENAGVLYVRAEVNKGIFEADRKAPVFHHIDGILELENRVFSLNKMKGIFGSSPCMLEGNISDFADPPPIIYTASMTSHPDRNEILWLIGQEKFRSLDFKGPSTLILSGKGPIEDYHVSAQWDLTQAAYAYPDIVEKSSARKNRFTGEIILNEKAVNLSSFDFDLPPAKITGSALFRFSGGIPLSFNIRSKAFDVREAVSILPVLRPYSPSGICLLDVAGKGDLSDSASIQWKGNVLLTDISFNPMPGIKPISGLTGKAFFNGHEMETSLFKARIGESGVQGKLRMDDFRKPELMLRFKSDSLRTEDLGLKSPEGEVNLNDVSGQMVIKDEIIQVDNLSFILGKSTFNLSGDIRDWTHPKITMTLVSPYIHSDDFTRLISLTYPKKEDNSSSDLKLDATIFVDTGTFKGVDFKKLDMALKYAPGIINIEKLEAGIFDGTIKTKGKADINPGDQNHYDVNIAADGISLEKIQHYMEIGDRVVTGKLSLKADVTATGGNTDDIKKSLAGAIQIRADKGVLKKFSVLSKIFSLLNVYQLFKFQLPDMAKDGMPYNKITANISVRKGVLSTEDFFIDSDAMKISGAGRTDYIKKKHDFIVGVHPLQTIDRIAAKVPIAGWLITDEKGNLITVHFEVDGSWDDPDVSPIPAKSIARGTLDMFRRIFQLPEKLITDTGEVILGH
jgi:hypothetical protein